MKDVKKLKKGTKIQLISLKTLIKNERLSESMLKGFHFDMEVEIFCEITKTEVEHWNKIKEISEEPYKMGKAMVIRTKELPFAYYPIAWIRKRIK